MRRRHTIGMCDYDYDDNTHKINIWYDSFVWHNNTEYIFDSNEVLQTMIHHNIVDEWTSTIHRVKYSFIEMLVLRLCEDKIFPLLLQKRKLESESRLKLEAKLKSEAKIVNENNI